MVKTDSITYEVIRHKLWSIADEQAIALMNVSGSSVVTDSRDFNNGLYLNDGSTVVFGRQMLRHAGTMSLILRNVIKECQENPGIEEGDMFIVNNPYQGAIHLPDVAVVAPFFHNNKCLAWFGACAHQLDVGGMEAGSLCPRATERYQEGLTISPVKLVEKGKLRKDIFNMILSNSRLPSLLGLDIHALISSNDVAKKRLSQIVNIYGAENIKRVMEESLDISERKLRQRLLELPDGIYRAADFLDNPSEDKIYKIALSMKKEKDSVLFDFSGSSQQAPHSINTTESVTVGGVLSIVLTTLAYDIPWNHGIVRPLTIKVPRGTICNAESPAAVSTGVASTGQCINNITLAAVNKLLSCSETYRHESGAVGGGFFIMVNLRGLNQYGETFGTSLLDTAGGVPAYYGKDGFGLGGRGITIPAIPNIETNENIAPILYLNRRYLMDGGGPGKFRGGRPLGLAFTPHDVKELKFVLVSNGVKVPSAMGIFGGYPGACNIGSLVKNSILLKTYAKSSRRDKTLKEERLDLANPTNNSSFVRPGDLLEYSRQGGGGYGSALDRDLYMVQKDLDEGIISPKCAEELYGVTIKRNPRGILSVSREDEGQKYKVDSKAKEVIEIGPYLKVVEKGKDRIIRCRCGYEFCDVRHNWKDSTVQKELKVQKTGPLVKLHKELEMKEYHCPSCGLRLWVEILKKGEQPLWDIELSSI